MWIGYPATDATWEQERDVEASLVDDYEAALEAERELEAEEAAAAAADEEEDAGVAQA